jgi:hypothetical protein
VSKNSKNEPPKTIVGLEILPLPSGVNFFLLKNATFLSKKLSHLRLAKNHLTQTCAVWLKAKTLKKPIFAFLLFYWEIGCEKLLKHT